MRKSSTYKPQQKAQVVLPVLSGTKSAAQICRDLNINETLLSRWKQQLLTHAALVFERESEATEKDQRIAELERLVGRLPLELENREGNFLLPVAKKPHNLRLIKPAKTGGD
jgi:transposase